MANWKIKRSTGLRGETTVPGDKSISHRAVILAALSNGPCVIRGFLPSEDCMRTVEAMRALGTRIEQPEPTTLVVYGRRKQFSAPERPIDCGNSGTTMRLMAGVLASQPFKTVLVGDESLSRRPMGRVIEPLTAMGAKIIARGEKQTPPLEIVGGPLKPIEYISPVASAQVKSAILLAALSCKGKTTVTEPDQSRDHTERMLTYFLARPQVDHLTVSVHGELTPESRDFTVPGDISSAAFWLVAAAAQPGAHLLVERVGLNKTRTGVLGVLVRMGAQVREIIEELDEAEPSGTIEIKGAQLRPTIINGRDIPNVIDELPILAVAGALAKGRTVIADAAELRVKESDRIASIVGNLKLMGVRVEERPDGLEIEGGFPLKGTTLPSFGDHRIAMAFAVAGLFAQGETVIENVECVETSYPGFFETLTHLAHPPKTATETPVIGSFSGGNGEE